MNGELTVAQKCREVKTILEGTEGRAIRCRIVSSKDPGRIISDFLTEPQLMIEAGGTFHFQVVEVRLDGQRLSTSIQYINMGPADQKKHTYGTWPPERKANEILKALAGAHPDEE